MVKIRTLNELPQLRDSDFNQPSPRHGVELLYWFAHVSHVNQLDPTNGDFGFHKFLNRIDDDEDKLLPDQNLPYYEVGNLNEPGADKLPHYVRPLHKRYSNDGNKDRIIVRLNHGRIDRVYVTEHADQKNFSHGRTYRVSQGLLNQIRGMERDEFLKRMQQKQQYRVINQSSNNYSYDGQNSRNTNDQQRDNSGSWCTIL
ncbi:uncharacterized protein LOC128604292 [Ictalurus furcatus]|uniref:uncharacterized protein LOC128604292 n=1 Tax=Ictalurus furcatus TaxID=66913 RepID=UPI00235029C0|nr:uncharacterized protein LOC128604292 [Ictalurus furcatus]XP_053475292.1 uncharacterized protein LOC128604292 [Ictalurus furcatus]